MEAIINALLTAGYYVSLVPGKMRENGLDSDLSTGGCTARIYSSEYFRIGVKNELWEAHANSPDAAIMAAANQIRERMRPAYESYIDLAEKLGWEE